MPITQILFVGYVIIQVIKAIREKIEWGQAGKRVFIATIIFAAINLIF